MVNIDGFGAPVSHQNKAAVDKFYEAAVLMLGFSPDPVSLIKSVLQSDPDFIMARCFLAGTYLVSSDKRNQVYLAAEYEVLRHEVSFANEREKGHIHAIGLWLAGDFYAASQAYADILAYCPRDLCALQFGHQIDFLIGQASSTRDRPSRVMKYWSDSDSEYSYILGMQAFGLEECGHYPQAQEMAMRCVELNPKDTWGVHALAHCYEMQGKTREGIDFMEGCEMAWGGDNYLAVHNRWHLSLYRMELCEFEHVLKMHDQFMFVTASSELMNLHDSAALLWRLSLFGVDVGDRWNAVADGYEKVIGQAYIPFTEMHAMMAFSATKRYTQADELIQSMTNNMSGASSSSMIIRGSGLQIVQGILEFGRGDYSQAKRLLSSARHNSHMIGGSVAQRDIVNLTLLEACVRSKDSAMVDALIAERCVMKPESLLINNFRNRMR